MPPKEERLSAHEVSQVVAYWATALRHEEALSTRPKARPPIPPSPVLVNLKTPNAGHTYFKVRPAEGFADLFLTPGERLELPLDGERGAFLEHCVRGAYRREWAAREGSEAGGESFMVGFPTLYLRRSQELACLVRAPVNVVWRRPDGDVFKPPRYRERMADAFPPLPEKVELSLEAAEEGVLPLAVDTLLLGRVLGVTDEELEDFWTDVRGKPATAETVLKALCRLLAPDEAEPPDEGLLERLLTAVKGRLQGTEQVFEVGLVYDVGQTNATAHLQREIGQLRQARLLSPPWGRESPVGAYLCGDAPAGDRAPHLARFGRRALAVDQREVAERFLASPFGAAQGPPGTGKTALILDLAAAAVVARAEALDGGQPSGRPALLVASTNNRAVDNVLDPLTGPDFDLPLGLRLGNQEITALVTQRILRRAAGWLQGQPSDGADAALASALSHFRALRRSLEAQVEPALAARQRYQRRVNLTAKLDALAQSLQESPETPRRELDLAEAELWLRKAELRLGKLLALAEDGGTLAALTESWRLTKRKVLIQLERALEPLEVKLKLGLPPKLEEDADADDALDAWADALERAGSRLTRLKRRLADIAAARSLEDQRALLTERLTEVEDALPPPPPQDDEPAVAALGHDLFLAAVEVRRRWAVVHRTPLLEALGLAETAAGERRSLRKLFEDEGPGSWLSRLFPVLGCTLLSLGNALPLSADAVESVVVDEAGQCHPAYALAALMRAPRALLLGDVHQLEPVVRLGRADEVRVLKEARVTLSPAVLEPFRVISERCASAQSLADRAVPDRLTLRAHFRCQRPIIELSDALCGYGLTVRTPPRSRADVAPFLSAPVLLLPAMGAQERVRGSYANPAELELVLRFTGSLLRAGVPPEDIALITPYVAQLEALHFRLRALGWPLEIDAGEFGDQEDLFTPLNAHRRGGLATGTVHRFQGGERSIVLFSTVVTEARSLGFVNERVNLVNVAVSRAQDHLIIVGDPATLSQGQHTRLLVKHAQPLI